MGIILVVNRLGVECKERVDGASINAYRAGAMKNTRMTGEELAVAVVRAIRQRGLTRYEPGYWERWIAADIQADVAAVMALESGDRWVAVTCLPLCAVRQAIIERNTVRGEGTLAVGETGTGRVLMAHVPGVVAGTNDAYALQENTRLVNAWDANGTIAVMDCWVVVVMEKDPRKSTFATEVETWGRCEWHIVHQPEAEGLVEVGAAAPAGWGMVEA